MKTVQPACNARAPRLESEIAAVMKDLFRYWPALLGFSVQQLTALPRSRKSIQIEDELCIADVTTDPWLTQELRYNICKEIAIALIELIDEVPAARELLRKRTFTRTLH